jgi:hypothetical protein
VHSHHNSSTLHVVETHLTMERWGTADGQRRWIAVSLSFDPADPWAVALDLYAEPAPVRWTFSRDLLIEGLHEPAGQGDVLVAPSLDEDGGAVVVIELRSPDGSLVGQLPARELTTFVHGVLAAVPTGAETAHLDVDALLDEMLHPGGERGRG